MTVLVGLVLLVSPLGRCLTHLSYDLPFFFRANIEVTNAVIIYMDEASEKSLNQGAKVAWDRRLHACLLTEVKQAGVPLAVFDIVFSDEGANADTNANMQLVRAVTNFGKDKVVVAVEPKETILDGQVGA